MSHPLAQGLQGQADNTVALPRDALFPVPSALRGRSPNARCGLSAGWWVLTRSPGQTPAWVAAPGLDGWAYRVVSVVASRKGALSNGRGLGLAWGSGGLLSMASFMEASGGGQRPGQEAPSWSWAHILGACRPLTGHMHGSCPSRPRVQCSWLPVLTSAADVRKAC